MLVLDLVVMLQLLQEELQARSEPWPERRELDRTLAILRQRRRERTAEFTEHVVPRQPELRGCSEIVMTLPGLARIALEKPGQVGR